MDMNWSLYEEQIRLLLDSLISYYGKPIKLISKRHIEELLMSINEMGDSNYIDWDYIDECVEEKWKHIPIRISKHDTFSSIDFLEYSMVFTYMNPNKPSPYILPNIHFIIMPSEQLIIDFKADADLVCLMCEFDNYEYKMFSL